MLKGRVELRPIAALMPEARQLGMVAISNPLQRFQREQPVLFVWPELSREIKHVVIEQLGVVAITKCKSDHLTGSPTRAAIVDVNVFACWGSSDLAQNLRNCSCGRRSQHVEELGSRVIGEWSRTPRTHSASHVTRLPTWTKAISVRLGGEFNRSLQHILQTSQPASDRARSFSAFH
jgi:hypothetical protein